MDCEHSTCGVIGSKCLATALSLPAHSPGLRASNSAKSPEPKILRVDEGGTWSACEAACEAESCLRVCNIDHFVALCGTLWCNCLEAWSEASLALFGVEMRLHQAALFGVEMRLHQAALFGVEMRLRQAASDIVSCTVYCIMYSTLYHVQ